MLGFPLGSVNAEYDVFKITYQATGVGGRGPHPQLTKQIEDYMNWRAEQTLNGLKNKNLTPAQTAEYM